jgi:hypothetical protein
LRYARKDPSPSGGPQISPSYFLQAPGIPLRCTARHSSPTSAIYLANSSFYKDFGSDPRVWGPPRCVSCRRRAEYTHGRTCTRGSIAIRISSRAGSAPSQKIPPSSSWPYPGGPSHPHSPRERRGVPGPSRTRRDLPSWESQSAAACLLPQPLAFSNFTRLWTFLTVTGCGICCP